LEGVKAIAKARVAVLLVSADFLTSKFIRSKEIPNLLERKDKEGLRIYPVIIKPCAWKQVKWLARMNLRPKDGKPISSGAEHQIDADLAAIVDEVAAIIESKTHITPLETSPTTYEDWVRDIEPEKMHISIEEPEKLAKPGNSIGMKFTLIPVGEFYMGSEEYDAEKHVHKVKINNPFYLGTNPMTQREWKAVMGSNPSSFKGDDLPVERVSWDKVQEFIKKLNEIEGTDKYRLPSEAEWEYACRAGTTTKYSFGDSEKKLGSYAWYVKNSDYKTHRVGQKKSNPGGLYDMHGNVWEWVQDEWHDGYDGAPTDGSAWESGDGAYRVFRGGSWYYRAWYCRSAFRGPVVPHYRDDNLGFRLLREL
jgi:formylglycine-generating enzyme required for sulfatase activity